MMKKGDLVLFKGDEKAWREWRRKNRG